MEPLGESARTTAIVVHYGPWATTQRTLDSLRLHAPGLQVRIVDNGGEPVPHGVEGLDRMAAQVLSASTNLGYGAACNLGARRASGDWLLFLNNDVEIQAGTLEVMAGVLSRHRDAAAVGPSLLDSRQRPVRSIGRAPSPRRVLFENLFLPRIVPGVPFFDGHHTVSTSHRRARLVETLLGAIVLVRRSAFEGVGGFCEDFFFYAEESDLFMRLRRIGWKVWFEPAARAIHHGGVASQTVGQREMDRRLHEALRLYAWRFHGEGGERRVARALRLGATLRWWLSFVEIGARRQSRRRRFADVRDMYRHGEPKIPANSALDER